MKALKKIATLVALSMPAITLVSCGFDQNVPSDYQEKLKIDVANISFEDKTVLLSDSIATTGYNGYQAQYKGTTVSEYSIPIDGVTEVTYTCKKVTKTDDGSGEIKTDLKDDSTTENINEALCPTDVGVYEYTISFKVNSKKYEEAESLTRRISIVYQNTTLQKISLLDGTATYDGTAKNLYATYKASDDTLATEIKDNLYLPGIAKFTYMYEGIDGTDYAKTENAPSQVGTYKVTLELEIADNYYSDNVIFPEATLTIEAVKNITVKASELEAKPEFKENYALNDSMTVLATDSASAKIDGATRRINLGKGKVTTTQNGIKVNVTGACVITVKAETTKQASKAINTSNNIGESEIAKLKNNLVALDTSTGSVVATSTDYITNSEISVTPEMAIYLPREGEYVIGGATSGIYIYEISIRYDKAESDVASYDQTLAIVKENYGELLDAIYLTLAADVQTDGNKAAKDALKAKILAATTKADAETLFDSAVEALRGYTSETNPEPTEPAVPANVTYNPSAEQLITTKTTEAETTLNSGLILLTNGRVDDSSKTATTPSRYNLGGQVKSTQNGIKFSVSAGCVVLVTATLSKTSSSTVDSTSAASKLLEKITIMDTNGATVVTASDYVGLTSDTYALYIANAGTYILGGDVGGLYITEITIAYDKTSTDVSTYAKTLDEVKATYKEVLGILYNSLVDESKTAKTTDYNTAVQAITDAADVAAIAAAYSTAYQSLTNGTTFKTK